MNAHFFFDAAKSEPSYFLLTETRSVNKSVAAARRCACWSWHAQRVVRERRDRKCKQGVRVNK